MEHKKDLNCFHCGQDWADEDEAGWSIVVNGRKEDLCFGCGKRYYEAGGIDDVTRRS